ncbi:MAG: hypothetical protein FJ291_22875 [Planctomycetes bacterium]|nr:hypothetical protein [Planctomycetota bacterium]
MYARRCPTTVHRTLAGGLPLILVALAGCTSPLFPELQKRVQKDLAFPMVLQNPSQHVGAVVIWGGVILSTANRKEGTEVVVLETPLDSAGRPLSVRYSRGRFIARTPAFLDPEVFRRDRRVTFGGEVTGSETRPLGDTQYVYPVIKLLDHYVWSEPAPAYYYGPYHYYDPYYWPYYYDPFRPGWGWRRWPHWRCWP